MRTLALCLLAGLAGCVTADTDAPLVESGAAAARPRSTAKGDKVPKAMRDVVETHNRVRAEHCAEPLVWSKKLASVAQGWADRLARECVMQHSGGKYGENLAAGTASALDGERVSQMWYDEVALYDFGRGGFSPETGHFTQVVWRATERIGCAVSECKGLEIWVCEYEPAGNVETQYRDNVKPKGSCR